MISIAIDVWTGAKNAVGNFLQLQDGSCLQLQDDSCLELNDGVAESTVASVNLDNSNNSGMIGVYY